MIKSPILNIAEFMTWGAFFIMPILSLIPGAEFVAKCYAGWRGYKVVNKVEEILPVIEKVTNNLNNRITPEFEEVAQEVKTAVPKISQVADSVNQLLVEDLPRTLINVNDGIGELKTNVKKVGDGAQKIGEGAKQIGNTAKTIEKAVKISTVVLLTLVAIIFLPPIPALIVFLVVTGFIFGQDIYEAIYGCEQAMEEITAQAEPTTATEIAVPIERTIAADTIQAGQITTEDEVAVDSTEFEESDDELRGEALAAALQAREEKLSQDESNVIEVFDDLEKSRKDLYKQERCLHNIQTRMHREQDILRAQQSSDQQTWNAHLAQQEQECTGQVDEFARECKDLVTEFIQPKVDSIKSSPGKLWGWTSNKLFGNGEYLELSDISSRFGNGLE